MFVNWKHKIDLKEIIKYNFVDINRAFNINQSKKYLFKLSKVMTTIEINYNLDICVIEADTIFIHRAYYASLFDIWKEIKWDNKIIKFINNIDEKIGLQHQIGFIVNNIQNNLIEKFLVKLDKNLD